MPPKASSMIIKKKNQARATKFFTPPVPSNALIFFLA
jgi:hypothetical protein